MQIGQVYADFFVSALIRKLCETLWELCGITRSYTEKEDYFCELK